ncbi:MAG: ketoacyl-ACP synthase III [Cyanobacteria bacterium]|nr:ketoacyl-ACP synthase III [Cyanobacteriota bacterium]MDA1020273.1 ketoacyl-ACP synthase III [Cyanobacteriota bacterium]
MNNSARYGAKIISWSRALPERVVTNDDLAQILDTDDEWITKRTGIKERRIADPAKAENATYFGAMAAKAALANAEKYSQTKIDASEIDLIICATATGDFIFPSTACMIQEQIGATNAAAFDMSAACTGFVFAINTAYNFIHAGQFKNIMVIGVDLMSKYIDWADRGTAVIFGDGAGACIISATDEVDDCFHSFYIKSRGDTEMSLYADAVANQYPIIAADIKDKPAMVKMNGKAVYEFAVKAVPEALEAAIKQAGFQADDIDYIIPHQANIRIVQSAAKRLNIPMDKFICNIERYGNTSAASIPIAFDEAFELGLIKREPGKKLKIALVGFGAGLTWGATIIEF